jgi:hypothetical protein
VPEPIGLIFISWLMIAATLRRGTRRPILRSMA